MIRKRVKRLFTVAQASIEFLDVGDKLGWFTKFPERIYTVFYIGKNDDRAWRKSPLASCREGTDMADGL